jgi:Ca2+-binding EF-hand superfamily protein
VKAENEKTLEKLRHQRAEDKAMLSKLAKEFDSHRKLTKVWLARLIENTVDPSSKEEIAKFLKVFSLYDKDGDGMCVSVCSVSVCIVCVLRLILFRTVMHIGMITLDEARSVMETLTDNMSESQLHKLVF